MKRRPQSDCIRCAGPGRWKLRIWTRRDPSDPKKSRLVQRTFASKEAAERVRDQLQSRDLSVVLGVRPIDQGVAQFTPTIGSVLDAYLRECETLGRSETHLRTIRQVRGVLVRWRDERADAQLTRRDLLDFVAWARVNTASKGRAVKNALVILRTALHRADLPVPALPRLELPDRVPKTYSRKELVDLMAVLPLGTVARTAAEIGLRTGARESEIRRLQVGDVDLERGTLLLRRAKGKPGHRGSEESVPVSPVLKEVLGIYIATQPVDLPPEAPFLALGKGEHRRELGASSLRRALERACLKAKVPRKTTVGWTRAQAATLIREAGMHLKKVSATLGHMDGRTTTAHDDECGLLARERWSAGLEAAGTIDKVLPSAYASHTLEAGSTTNSPPGVSGKLLKGLKGP